jgi:hypothetical protein
MGVVCICGGRGESGVHNVEGNRHSWERVQHPPPLGHKTVRRDGVRDNGTVFYKPFNRQHTGCDDYARGPEGGRVEEGAWGT